jgi:putative DNA primase/helicase
MSPEYIARSLGLRRAGREYTGQCPSCGYKTGFSVTERDGRILAYCAAGGCDQRAIWAALRKAGVAPDGEREREPRAQRRRKARAEPKTNGAEPHNEEEAAAEAAAAAIWRRSVPANGTLAEVYLRHRGYTGPIPGILRFCSSCKHPSGGYHPTMIAGVCLQGDRSRGVAVHRTFLALDGRGKTALEPQKMTLGPCRGGAVPLVPAASTLAVSEGIETGLSYMAVTGIPTWAALSTSGIRNLILPDQVREVIIACDADIQGVRAAQAAARRWLAEGRQVRIARPPLRRDFNDLLRAS